MDLVRYFISQNLEFKLFTNGSRLDYEFANKILKELDIKPEDYLIERPLSTEELVDIVTSFNKILSFRLHSIIIAAAYNIPFLGFVWDQKVIDFCQKLDNSHVIIIPNDNIIFHDIINSLNIIDFSNRINASAIGGVKSKNDLIYSLLPFVKPF